MLWNSRFIKLTLKTITHKNIIMHQKQVIPTVFATDLDTFLQKLNKLSFAKFLHLDFMDGQFVKNSSISLEEMKRAISKYPHITFEIHLMAYEPQQYIEIIKSMNIKKVHIQYEAFKNSQALEDAVDEFKREKIKVSLVLNPSTPPQKAISFIEEIDSIMLMSVWPGKEGQTFIESTFEKISFLRNSLPSIDIQIDGGIKDTNIRKITRSGANILSIGSYIFKNNLPKDNYERLSYLVNN